MPDLLSLRGVINDTHVLFHTVSAAPDVCALPNHQAVDDIDGQGDNDYASEEQQIINASCFFWAFDDSRAMAMAFSMNRRFYSRCRWLRLPRITYRHQAWCLFVFYLRSLACFHRSLICNCYDTRYRTISSASARHNFRYHVCKKRDLVHEFIISMYELLQQVSKIKSGQLAFISHSLIVEFCT